MKNSALGIIFRLPEFGKVKKRLAAQIGDSEALNAYASMLHITIERTSTLKDIDIYGFYRSESEATQPKVGASLSQRGCSPFETPKRNYFFFNREFEGAKAPSKLTKNAILPFIADQRSGHFGIFRNQEIKLNNLTTLPQQGENLGEIMLNAFDQLFAIGYNRVLLIGADSPDLPLHYITEAISKLDLYDLIIGPTEDGGFYLIGSRKPLSNQIFQDIGWGSRTVLKDTLNNAQKLKINYFLLNTWYDIDDKEGLDRWKDKFTKSLKNTIY